jgi:nitrite reductase (NADH) small subunit
MTAAQSFKWQAVCTREDLVEGSGVCALVGKEQVALFYLPDEEQQVYALSNRDPIGGANVLSRGVLGDLGGRLVVASPLYKQHFDLLTGECLEQEEVHIEVYKARLDGETVLIGH